jgi:RNA polymerase sigma factor (TIGR02999 family)
MRVPSESVTVLLHQLSGGDRQAFDALMPLVYEQLRKLAARCMASERGGHTLPATALVHEAYLRLAGSDASWENRTHFYAVAARVMRSILVDHARTKKRNKRGGAIEHLPLDEAIAVGPEAPAGILELDDALRRLAERDPRKSHVVEMLFFGGMTYEETAAALGISPATVHRELKLAKAWLYTHLASSAAQPL